MPRTNHSTHKSSLSLLSACAAPCSPIDVPKADVAHLTLQVLIYHDVVLAVHLRSLRARAADLAAVVQ